MELLSTSIILAFGTLLILGTASSLTVHSQWWLRSWDFPRVHLASLCFLTGLLAALILAHGLGLLLFEAALLLTAAWHISHIFPYTPLAKVSVQSLTDAQDADTFTIVVSNVEMENEQYELWLRRMRSASPDILIANEVNSAWLDAIRELTETYPYRVGQPQDNHYGILLLSRFPLENSAVRFLVQEDVPSVHTDVRLPNGQLVHIVGLHPRPPEPKHAQDSGPRDAELLLVGREIAELNSPCIVMGDLNDVAWSRSTKLFLRLSGLLDPRRGREFYNTFNARYPLLRFPLDHVFHSKHFRLAELKRLEAVGSDHFPILTTLSYPEMRPDQQTKKSEPGDAYEIKATQLEVATFAGLKSSVEYHGRKQRQPRSCEYL